MLGLTAFFSLSGSIALCLNLKTLSNTNTASDLSAAGRRGSVTHVHCNWCCLGSRQSGCHRLYDAASLRPSEASNSTL